MNKTEKSIRAMNTIDQILQETGRKLTGVVILRDGQARYLVEPLFDYNRIAMVLNKEGVSPVKETPLSL